VRASLMVSDVRCNARGASVDSYALAVLTVTVLEALVC
jgi:hypothetical protein